MFWYSVVLLSFGFFIENSEAGTKRIFNGQSADILDYPYMVTLRNARARDFCGGAIIGKNRVLTAAHCVSGQSAASFNVHSGTSFAQDRGQVHRVAGYKIHPGYNGTQAASWINDIAVVTLKDTIAYDETQQPAKLPDKDVEDGRTAVLTGWGMNTATSSLNQLQRLETTLILAKFCKTPRNLKLYDTQVCAFNNKQAGACFGDSGSPLAIDGTVIGVTSWIGSKTCTAGYADVYTKVYDYLDFIQSVMRSD